MANPRQRRKAKSSTHRPVSHSRHAQRNLKKTPPIRGPKVLQDAWDKRKTVKQNYAALGLVHTLNSRTSGGSEIIESYRQFDAVNLPEDGASPNASTQGSTSAHPLPTATEFPSSAAASSVPTGYGKLIRDPSGKVIGMHLADDDDEDAAEGTDGRNNNEGLDGDMEALEPELPQRDVEQWVSDLGRQQREPEPNTKHVVPSLERISASTSMTRSGSNARTISASLSGAGPRHASEGERLYLQRLVEKYGVGKKALPAMARDRKLNTEQRTEGQLAKALKRTGFVS